MTTPPDPPVEGRPARDIPAGPLMPEPPPDTGVPSSEPPPASPVDPDEPEAT